MGRYSYGAFLTVLSLCSPRSTTNKYLCGTIFLSVNPSYDILDDDGAVAHLKNCSNNVSPLITDNIMDADATHISECFEKKIIPLLEPSKLSYVAASIIDIFLNDDSIADSCPIGVINPTIKGRYRKMNEFVLADLLADFFIFSVSGITNKSGKKYIQDITKDYINSQSVAASNIKLISKNSTPAAGLPKTLNGKNFYSVFTKVAEAQIGIKGHEELKIFTLNVEDNEFTYEGLRKLLNANIGRYVFSRLAMEQYRKNDDLESVGGEAAQFIRENATGNELGDMLVYAFLEEILCAPKLMSAIELGNSDKTSSGIHLHTIPGAMNSFQLVYGASDINGGLKTAIDNAFDSVQKIKNNRITGNELVYSAAFNRSIDSSIADQVKSIIIPEKSHQNRIGTAYGLFIGYSVGLDPEDYTPEEFPTILYETLKNDITVNASYIYDKIKNLKLGSHSFYIYVLPFNDADTDKANIIDRLIGGVQ